MIQQKELFDGFVRHTECRRCGRTLHSDKRRQYRTRVAGLCFRCLADFNAANTYDVDRFISETTDSHHGTDN